MRVLRDALVTWRFRAVEAVQDQRILTQTLALESYEQALSEVGDERAALEERVAALRASVVGLEDKLLRQTEEFVAEFARLQAEEYSVDDENGAMHFKETRRRFDGFLDSAARWAA